MPPFALYCPGRSAITISMKHLLLSLFGLIALAAASVAPAVASAHEVYVLSQDEIRQAVAAPIPDFIGVATAHIGQFFEWMVISIVLVMAIFFASIAKPIEMLLDPILLKIKHWAPAITQATVGLALIASAAYNAAFGPELPFESIFGHFALAGRVLFGVSGLLMLFGIYPRIAGGILALLFVPLAYAKGIYTLSYATYLGEALFVLFFGASYSLTTAPFFFKKDILPHLHKYKFVIMRVFFGVSLIFASVYAKLIHGDLALQTVTKYHLTNYFHFDPLFLVLGAMIVEILLGLFFMVGFEVRFTSIFFLTFLTMSLVFFGEAVWPHIILIGTALSMFVHGYDRYTLTAFLSRRKDLEPVL